MQNEDITNTLESLEVKVAYQDDTLELLNQTVIQQQGQIEILQQQINVLINKMKSMANEEAPSSDEIELPPHY